MAELIPFLFRVYKGCVKLSRRQQPFAIKYVIGVANH